MGQLKYDLHEEMRLRRTLLVFDDFTDYTSAASNGVAGWTTVTGGSGTVSCGDLLGGQINLLPTDSTTNREVYVRSTRQVWKFSSTGSMCCEALLQFSEANTNKANIAFGFMSGVAAASMADTTGEPKSSFSGAVIYKVPGGTVWKTCSSLGTTQTVNTSDTTAGGSSFQRLRIEIMPLSSTLAEVTYFVDGVQLKTTGGRPGTTQIKDQLTYTGAIAMGLFVMCKNGSTTPESLFVDYIGAELLRATFTGF